MRVVVTGGAGFIGRAVVERLAARGDTVVALVRDPARVGHLAADRVELVPSSLEDPVALRASLAGADALVHAAGSYRVGIRASERAAMWDAKRRDHGTRARRGRGCRPGPDPLCLHPQLPDEARIRAGAPLVIAMPGQTYRPHDHSLAGGQLEQAHAGRLRYRSFTGTGLAWVHVDDLADGLVAVLDRGRQGEAYGLGGECRRMGEAVAIAARVAGRRPPRPTLPVWLVRLAAPLNDTLDGLPGMPANIRETIRASDGVTCWARHDKATRDLGFAPRSLQQGIVDTWGRAGA